MLLLTAECFSTIKFHLGHGKTVGRKIYFALKLKKKKLQMQYFDYLSSQRLLRENWSRICMHSDTETMNFGHFFITRNSVACFITDGGI